MSRLFPSPGAEKAHRRIEQRSIEAVAEAAGIKDAWPAGRPICRVCRSRQVKKGTWQETKETVYLTGYRPPAPHSPSSCKPIAVHSGSEIMHRR